MSVLLRIDASARTDGSYSRSLADDIEDCALGARPDLEVVRRDLAADPIPQIDSDTIEAFFSGGGALSQALKTASELSDTLIEELNGADILLISAPMYNFGMPSALKAWIDQIVRVNKTFKVEGHELIGLLKIKTAILSLSYGAPGYLTGGRQALDYLQPYLIQINQLVGIERTHVYAIDGTAGGADAVSAPLDELKARVNTEIPDLVRSIL